MTVWKAGYPVEYSAASEENIDSWAQKYIAEIDRIYTLLQRIRHNDMASGEPADTVPYQWHFDYDAKTLSLRNSADDGWINIGRFKADETGFYFAGTIIDDGGVTAISIGMEKPIEPAEKTIFFDTAENKTYYYVNGAWKQVSGDAIYKNADGKIIGDLAGNADSASTAIEATHAATATLAENSQTTDRLAQPVKINGVSFDGSKSINIDMGGGGSSTETYGLLANRVTQAERELANIQLALVDSQVYPDYNNLLTENFKDNYSVNTDYTRVNVTSLAAGDDSMDVDGFYGLIVGGVYTLTDGEQQEQVQIKGLAKTAYNYRVVLEAPTVNTYKVLPQLIRTTAYIFDGAALGSSVTKSYRPIVNGDEWRGSVSSVTDTLAQALDNENLGSFNIDGEIVFIDGFATLGGE